MTLENFIKFRDWLFDFTANMTNDHILGEQEVLYMVKDKFTSLGLNDNKIDKEPIDEEKLDELAINECAEILKDDTFCYEYGNDEGVECVVVSSAENCYKAGYRKAKDE